MLKNMLWITGMWSSFNSNQGIEVLTMFSEKTSAPGKGVAVGGRVAVAVEVDVGVKVGSGGCVGGMGEKVVEGICGGAGDSAAEVQPPARKPSSSSTTIAVPIGLSTFSSPFYWTVQ